MRGDLILKGKKITMLLLIIFALIFIPSNVSNASNKYYYKTKYVTTKKYLGKYKITHYCPCKRCCGGYTKTASGTRPKAKRTIAVDSNYIKLGSKVKIGKTTYIAEDTGGAIKGKKIDIFVKSHSEALKKGVKYQKVYLITKKKVRVKCKK